MTDVPETARPLSAEGPVSRGRRGRPSPCSVQAGEERREVDRG